ncbi:MAG: tail fiber domain-containing protein [Candidatus Izemoplasmatales bacterium]|nr:tail fiber domain-containing protein [Candidatus Izemoplasmatales bacterium]
MNKKYLIVSLFFLVIVFTSYYFASAATVGVPNPGHTWAEMECSASTLCIDNVNSRLGIGTNDPRSTLNIGGGGIAIGSGTAINTTDGSRRSIQIASDTSYGGTYNNHTGYLMYVTMPGGWGTGTLNFARGTNWSVYDKNPTMSLAGNNVGIGTTTPSTKLEVNGNVTAAAYYYTSDIRLKDNVSFLENSLSKILKLEGISYTLQSTKEDKLGFSAQELQKIYPELVKVGSDGYLSIDGTGLIAPLVEAIKEQQAMIELQQKEINELKNIINNLK